MNKFYLKEEEKKRILEKPIKKNVEKIKKPIKKNVKKIKKLKKNFKNVKL